MLDRLKLIRQITNCSSQITSKQDNQLELALKTWQFLITDPEFKVNLAKAKLEWNVPTWDGELNEFKQLAPNKFNYTVVASDGSQIYPDRHMGSNYYVINTGIVTLRYDTKSSASFNSEPYFFTDLAEGNVADYVDSKRHELEIADGLKVCLHETGNVFYLADGSLIAWHLFGKSENFIDQFMPNYLQQLQTFYQHKTPIIGYTSLPNSKEVVNLLRAKLCNFEASKFEINYLQDLVDSDLLAILLQPLQFTTWFKSNVAAVKSYPEHLKIYFAYCHTCSEIARIELPAWVVQDQGLLDLCMQVVVDQIQKGYGYPVALSEAHQQAVIKTQDRNFFYQVINQVSKKDGKLSYKLRQKQVMHI